MFLISLRKHVAGAHQNHHNMFHEENKYSNKAMRIALVLLLGPYLCPPNQNDVGHIVFGAFHEASFP